MHQASATVSRAGPRCVMSAPRAYDSAGNEIRIGPVLGTGGEGSVYEVVGKADRVIKLYATTPDARKARKIETLVHAFDESVAKIAAWPCQATFQAPHGRL